ncbi:hypothetical protein B9Z19DRAFT_1121607 [Tuber borchii]|uniref:Uncharacterized protein n=1 Tax=Tuber borchii TaxID=42251 RepID=A0A2T7A271_TUBBO|nr:hypothetical protein B9Z19DRAFT_1121607 [Tuber borchii]
MAPLNSDTLRSLDQGLEKIISFIKSIPSYVPLSNTYLYGVESSHILDQVVPYIPPTPLTPSLLPVPTGFELKSPGPENVPWEEDPTLKKTNEYLELIENPWSYHRKRSIQDYEPLAMALDGSGLGSSVRQRLGGGYYLTCSQELSLLIFIIVAIVSIGSAILWTVRKSEKKLSRHVDRCLAELDADEEKLPLSTELEWKPLVPETETLLEISDREATDEFVEFVSKSQWWDNNRKRSVQDQGRPATAMETAPVGEYRSSHFQEILMVIFIILIAIFWMAAVMLATNRIERWLRCRPTSSRGELGEDEGVYARKTKTHPAPQVDTPRALQQRTVSGTACSSPFETLCTFKVCLEHVVVEVFVQVRVAATAAGDIGEEEASEELFRVRWVEAYFLLTSPSWELQVYWQGNWLELNP